MILAVTNIQQANALTAGDVLNKMTSEQSVSYINGVIEGLAYSRWLRDRPSSKGSKCIYDWYYQGGKKSFNQTMSWLERHPDKPVGALIYVLTKKKCGE